MPHDIKRQQCAGGRTLRSISRAIHESCRRSVSARAREHAPARSARRAPATTHRDVFMKSSASNGTHDECWPRITTGTNNDDGRAKTIAGGREMPVRGSGGRRATVDSGRQDQNRVTSSDRRARGVARSESNPVEQFTNSGSCGLRLGVRASAARNFSRETTPPGAQTHRDVLASEVGRDPGVGCAGATDAIAKTAKAHTKNIPATTPSVSGTCTGESARDSN